MTCRGYDPKAVKVNKSIKRVAATILDNHARGAFIRDYVNVLRNQSRVSSKKNSSNEDQG